MTGPAIQFQYAGDATRPTRVALVYGDQTVGHASTLNRAAGFADGFAARMGQRRRCCPGEIQGERRSLWFRGWDRADEYCRKHGRRAG